MGWSVFPKGAPGDKGSQGTVRELRQRFIPEYQTTHTSLSTFRVCFHPEQQALLSLNGSCSPPHPLPPLPPLFVLLRFATDFRLSQYTTYTAVRSVGEHSRSSVLASVVDDELLGRLCSQIAHSRDHNLSGLFVFSTNAFCRRRLPYS